MITRCSITPSAQLPVGKGQRAGVTHSDLSDSVRSLINIRPLTLRSQFCFDKTFIGSQDATIVITQRCQLVWFSRKPYGFLRSARAYGRTIQSLRIFMILLKQIFLRSP